MRGVQRKSVAKSSRKITLPKARASEILDGLRVASSERQHAKRAVAAAKAGAVHEAGNSGELRRKTSELRIGYRESRKGAKAKKL